MQCTLIGTFLRFSILTFVIVSASVAHTSEPVLGAKNPDVLQAVANYYHLTESEVIERLAREEEAARTEALVKHLLGDSYAGSWFDEDELKLAVGLNDAGHMNRIRQLGAIPVLFEHSLEELELIRDQLRSERVRESGGLESVVGHFIDYPTNRVVLEVLTGSKESVELALDLIGTNRGEFEIREISSAPVLTNQVRGGGLL